MPCRKNGERERKWKKSRIKDGRKVVGNLEERPRTKERSKDSLVWSFSTFSVGILKEGQEFAVGPFISGNLSRRWASDINSTP